MKWINEQEALDQVLHSAAGLEVIALDTEADSLHSYFDKVCLVQLSAASEDYVIDPLASVDLAALGELLATPGVRKILHGADYDLRILNRDFGFTIANLTDTMVSAQLLGYEGVGLAALLKKHFNIELDKANQRADWAMRPLTPRMLDYAALDTHYLIRLAAILEAELREKGRWEWAVEEFSRLEAIRFREPVHDPESFRKIKGSQQLDRRGLAVLQRLHRWRDGIARKQDRPPFKVLGNDIMLEMAVKFPANKTGLMAMRGVSRYLEPHMNEILRLIQEAVALPEAELPLRREARPWDRDPELERRVDRLKKVRDRHAADLKIEPSILAPKHVLTAIGLLAEPTLESLASIPAMRKWQQGIMGASFIEALSGVAPKASSSPQGTLFPEPP